VTASQPPLLSLQSALPFASPRLVPEAEDVAEFVRHHAVDERYLGGVGEGRRVDV
jgi:hypothetical protein